MTLPEIEAEIARIEAERKAADAAYAAQLAPLQKQRCALQAAALEAKWRKKIAGYPLDVVAALRESDPPRDQWPALIRRGLAHKGWTYATWSADGVLARGVLVRMDKEKA